MPNNSENTFKFQDRAEAGYILANRLRPYSKLRDVIVLALPRGGVPVGAEIARALGVPLSVFIVRKVGVPGHRELAMGAVISGGNPRINLAVTRRLHLSKAMVDSVVRRETRELSRTERLYNRQRGAPDVRDRIVILADDGAATGSSLSLAVQTLREQGAAEVVVAVPVASPPAIAQLTKIADEVVCVMEPKKLVAVSRWYQQFDQLTDQHVCDILDRMAGQGNARKSA
jgi:predicted phosphoribosyltransferase